MAGSFGISSASTSTAPTQPPSLPTYPHTHTHAAAFIFFLPFLWLVLSDGAFFQPVWVPPHKPAYLACHWLSSLQMRALWMAKSTLYLRLLPFHLSFLALPSLPLPPFSKCSPSWSMLSHLGFGQKPTRLPISMGLSSLQFLNSLFCITFSYCFNSCQASSSFFHKGKYQIDTSTTTDSSPISLH